MKKFYFLNKIFFLVIVLLLSENLLSQIDSTYVPFPTDSVAWNESGVGLSGFDMPHYYNYFLYMKGDTTTVDNKLYNVIYRSFTKPFDPNGGIYGYLREENKIVYFKEYNVLNPEEIFYDFTLNIGDTTWYPKYGGYSILDKIDSVVIEDGSFRKRYNYATSNYGMTIIEGIGNVEVDYGGLLEPNMDSFFEYSHTMNCVIRPNEVIYINRNIPAHNCYKLGVSINEVMEDKIKPYPNPFKNTINFERELNKVSISIYSLSGKLLFKNESFSENQIDLSSLHQGIYFLKIENELHKIIKI